VQANLNNLRKYKGAIFSEKALAVHSAGGKVQIEHVTPHRALTCLAIDKIQEGISDEAFAEFIKSVFQIVLLTPEETAHLNKTNRSKIDPDRLKKAGIVLASN
jgi:transcriptional regulator CtsR